MNKFRIVQTSIFKRDLKLAIRRGYNIKLLECVVDLLASGDVLPAKYNDHCLRGNYQGCRECHISPDWLLVYERENNELILYLTRIGTHADLF